jgi:hypothetical protein
MNKVIATAVGLSALSAALVQAQDASMTPPPVKDWSVAASLRGFYDDNYLTQPRTIVGVNASGATTVSRPLGSYGTEIIPSAAWSHHSGETTTASVSYIYDLKWYENRSDTDQQHQLNMGLQHEISPQYRIALGESFVIAQQPTVIDPSVISTPLRVAGNNVRNTGSINLSDAITKELDLQLGYVNTLYDYPELANSVIGYPFGYITSGYPNNASDNGNVAPQPSRSALLNRMEQVVTLDMRWKYTPSTTAILGYKFGTTWYTSGEYINYPYGNGSPYLTPAGAPLGSAFKGDHSNVRDSQTHYAFIGADETFSPLLNASLRVGAEYLDYYNNVDQNGNSDPTSRVSPYVDASLTDQYQPGCSVVFGVKEIHNSTDVVGVTGDLIDGKTVPVLDEESTAIYFSDHHKLSEKLSANVMGQAQISSFTDGGPEYNGKLDQFFILQVNFSYRFTPWLSSEAGYNYSRLKSDLPGREYTRDIMYLGVRATY